MDDEKYWVAIASSDGIVVNSHFGKASCFYIYEVSGNEEVRLVEKRTVTPICKGGEHNDDRLEAHLTKFIDCKYVLVSRIGNGAATVAERMGITPMEIPGEIDESIHQLIKYIKIQNLMDNIHS